MQDGQSYSRCRQYYRIRYPGASRPKIRIKGEDYESDVVELSERGARFLYKGTMILGDGQDMTVVITFHDDETVELEGEVLRVADEDVIVRFSGGLSLGRIMKEQIYLRNHFIGHM